MQWDKVPPGNTISNLPHILQKPALLCRNLFYRFFNPVTYDDTRDDVVKSLVQSVDYACRSGVEGDLAEFGTMSGITASAISQRMAHLVDRKNSPIASLAKREIYRQKKVHLFDSFEGLPESESEVDRQNIEVKMGVWKKGSCLGVTADTLRSMCNKHLPDDSILIYEGWFSNTMPQIKEGTTFCFIHIDCDLYQSTMDVLVYLFDHRMVSEGAVILFDDFNCCKASPDYGERKAWQELIKTYHIEFSDLGSYGWAGWKFIIHSYRV